MTGITSKGYYGILTILELAKHYNKKLIQIDEITEARNIPKSYLIQILYKFKTCKLVKSYRGNKGGYKLAKSPDEITLLDIITEIEGNFDIFKNYHSNDVIKMLFNKLELDLRNSLNICLNELLYEQEKIDQKMMYFI